LPIITPRSGDRRIAPAYAAAVRRLPIFYTLLLLILPPGVSARASPEFDALSAEFVYSSLALTPVTATAQGYHRHRGVLLDEELGDFSPAGMDHALRFYRDWERRLDRLDASGLDAEQQADVQIIRNAVSLALLNLETIQAYRHNPTVYVELIGAALFDPFRLDYAPIGVRFGHIIKRLEKMPALLDQARSQLTDAPPVWIKVARDENAGNFKLIDQILRMQVPAPQKIAYAAAAGRALDALREFNSFMERTLSARPHAWQLGATLYREKCGYELSVGHTPEELLESAAADLKATRDQMAKLAAPLSVPQALDRIARQHPTPDGYLEQARLSLRQATQFVRASALVALPGASNLQVIETPEFLRGIYSVGGFDPAPALEPQLGAFYFVTPIPASWPRERVESKLREYNDFGIQHLTIHEAMPGHWVQADYANRIQPEARRLLRTLYGNGPYVEGWAIYAQQMMVDQGYLDGNDPLRLTLLKQLLRSICNTILDIRLHTMGMTDQQAMDLMVHEGFQESEEAGAKLVRAKLSSCQLATYYAGFKGWLEVRDRFRQRHPGDYSLSGFNERALAEGAVTLPALDRLLQ
jgi:uncharacterized protein (DUF885 family)